MQAGAGGVETGGNDAAVVEDQQVARTQNLRQIAEELSSIRAGGAVKNQHAAGAANRRRGLGDQFFGKVEIEVGYTHLHL